MRLEQHYQRRFAATGDRHAHADRVTNGDRRTRDLTTNLRQSMVVDRVPAASAGAIAAT